MEQGIRENDMVLLRFKYYSFYDLNPKVSIVSFRYFISYAHAFSLVKVTEDSLSFTSFTYMEKSKISLCRQKIGFSAVCTFGSYP